MLNEITIWINGKTKYPPSNSLPPEGTESGAEGTHPIEEKFAVDLKPKETLLFSSDDYSFMSTLNVQAKSCKFRITSSKWVATNDIFGCRKGGSLWNMASSIYSTHRRIYHQAWWTRIWVSYTKTANGNCWEEIFGCFNSSLEFKHPSLVNFFLHQVTCDFHVNFGWLPVCQMHRKWCFW